MTQHNREWRVLLTWLLVSATLVCSALGSTSIWNESPVVLDPSSGLRPSTDEDLWRDSLEESHIYMPILKSRLLDGPQRAQWREAMESVKRWLNSHAKPSSLKSDYIDNEVDGHNPQAKRNGGGYMCHFKLCQLGASNSGKRRWNPNGFN